MASFSLCHHVHAHGVTGGGNESNEKVPVGEPRLDRLQFSESESGQRWDLKPGELLPARSFECLLNRSKRFRIFQPGLTFASIGVAREREHRGAGHSDILHGCSHANALKHRGS